MEVSRSPWNRIALGVLLFAPALFAAGEVPALPPLPPAPLQNAEVLPALKAAARRDHVLLFNVDETGPTPLNGDATVAWIGARDGKSTRQWLIQLSRGVATAAEQTKGQKKDAVRYLSWGPVIRFKSDVEALDLWIAGPVVVGAPAQPDAIAPVKRVRVLVPADYLRLGLDDSVRIDDHFRRRVQALQKEDPKFNPGHIYALDRPVKPENIAYAKPVAEKIGYSPEMERAWAGGYVALQAFYDLATGVSELEAIASTALDRPSVFQLAKLATGTKFMTYVGGASTRVVDPAKLGLVPVATETFDAPFSFGFGQALIVSGRIVLTRPVPPFDTTAGILAMVAVHPKDTNRQVHVIIIGGHRGGPEKKTPQP